VTDDGKAACHSDYVDPEKAKEIQGGEKLVQLNTAPAHNIATEDRVPQ
jgi:phosphomethylpyrimidine synthase